MKFCWLLGHKKKYVGVEDLMEKRDFYPQTCPHGWHSVKHCGFCWKIMQIARWACIACNRMGEDHIWRGQGLFTVQFGELVPDEKKWANFKFYESMKNGH